VRLNEFYFKFREFKCVRRACTCPAGSLDWLLKSAPQDHIEDSAAANCSTHESSTDEPLTTEGGSDRFMAVSVVRHMGEPAGDRVCGGGVHGGCKSGEEADSDSEGESVWGSEEEADNESE